MLGIIRDLAVVAAVRQRVDVLQVMLQSLRATADHPEQIDIVLRCDFDDEPMIAYLRSLAQPRFIVGPRLSGYECLPAFANEAARLSKADLVLVVSDDAEFVTPGWNTKLLATAARYPDGIFDLGVDTVLNNPNFVFPCTSRRVIEILGGIFDERIIYGDIWLRDVMQPFGRALHVPDVTVRHNWTGVTPDQKRAIRVVPTPDYQALYHRSVDEARAKIRHAMSMAAVS